MAEKERLIIFTQPGCPPCDKLKKDMKDPDKVDWQDVSKSKKARERAQRHGINSAPGALLATKEGYKKCELYFDHQKGRPVADCEGKEIDL